MIGGGELVGIVNDVCCETGGVGGPRCGAQLGLLQQMIGGIRKIIDHKIEQHLMARQHRLIH